MRIISDSTNSDEEFKRTTYQRRLTDVDGGRYNVQTGVAISFSHKGAEV